ncbi:hypothetical protein HanRHA438_Chr01g0002651 [Helianthus annuus]|nr:hypothetical protein HanRHA438_Chr01g0002651 [Helianthus annuus]
MVSIAVDILVHSHSLILFFHFPVILLILLPLINLILTGPPLSSFTCSRLPQVFILP